ncbi:MAG: hypothetical protein CVV42_19230 [Candidatus Riflebacteria bacterium HGW-Riflebacteria-2]|jgi:HSP20 family protein|nr:MAG: hypothetical protein CVV42_19230 [Candidatus Riflebacteria bacterium HGW-Riflebacteria-2]
MLNRKMLIGLSALLIVSILFFAIPVRTAEPEKATPEKDEFLKPKSNAPEDPLDSFQQQFESLLRQPFFKDPSLNNLRGFDLFNRNINDHFDRMLKNFDSISGMNFPTSPFTSSMLQGDTGKTDIREVDDKILVKVDMPGLDKNSIDLKLRDNNLIITSERKDTITSNDDKAHVYRNEVSYGSFSRVIELPRRVIEEKVDATYENGVLTVIAPVDKAAPESNAGRKITIN